MLASLLLRRRMPRYIAGRVLMRRIIHRMIWRRVVVVFLLVLLGDFALHARGQAAPGGGIGGMSPEDQQALTEQMQQMQAIQQDVLTNMQNAGVDTQAFMQDMQQQMQNGTFDITAMEQQLVARGFMTQQQADQVNSGMNRLQGVARNVSLNAIRAQLGSTDDEWAILLPKIQRIFDLLPDVKPVDALNPNATGGGGAMGGRGGMRGMALTQGAPTTETGKAFRALKDILKEPNASDDRVAARLTAWRDLHQKAVAQLTAAREDLVSILTLRQEAVLLSLGVL